ncbi:MAG: pirin family protein [Acidobacteriota bacterium]
MITIRRAAERGHFDHGWLNTYHTFSFADYHDPAHMGFRDLRVINEDRVIGGQGFGTHGHRDMEILSYVLEGRLAHRDSLGNGGEITPGEIQRMSAGTGVRHSEFNGSNDEPLHFLQIWILPERPGLAPGYEQKSFSIKERTGKLCLLASGDARQQSVKINQDVDVFTSIIASGQSLRHEFRAGRNGWLQVARGHALIGDEELMAGDGVAITDEPVIDIQGEGEILLFDLN